eukprot:CAMPEP_0114413482 /NCGR_PEP_ID=MMETSP0103-20121206/879_1 /TAXON_ID=37642 ORGANISM="Paraphysomonas imperforata, Strain PA2" /NCGR_SAMPLE_ID=MMETSP0103 /ASSEMBLY_ACC=CAM_ASM_000201 /LENGTH=983 /DNA_ID=CAMNT_0001581561 /DNA_START=13 /DNA_END=2964 /DNA_ORIENTATION=-
MSSTSAPSSNSRSETDSLKVSSSGDQDDDQSDEISIGSYSTAHTFQTSMSENQTPLRKETPSMKKKVTPGSRTGQDDESACSGYSSVHPITPIAKLDTPKISESNTEDEDDVMGATIDFTKGKIFEMNQERSDSFYSKSDSYYSKVNRDFETRSSSLYSLSHATGSNIEKLYMTSSIHENLALHVRCGYAQKKNDRKSMEDCITVCPSAFHSNPPTPGRDSPDETATEIGDTKDKDDLKEKPLATDDFSFFGVFDGHDGSYVSQYLQNHLLSYFQDSLSKSKSEADPTQSFNDASSAIIRDQLYKKYNVNKWKSSILEAACKIDREILGSDLTRLQDIADKRTTALQEEGSDDVADALSKEDVSSSFGGSTAAVVVVYRDLASEYTPQHGSIHSSPPPPPAPQYLEPTGMSSRPPIPPSPQMDKEGKTGPDDDDNNDNDSNERDDEEGGDQFQDDVEVGVFGKRDSAAYLAMNGRPPEQEKRNDLDSDGSSSSKSGDVVGMGPCPEPFRMPLQARKKRMARYSSVESNYDSAVELNLDDDQLFSALENINNKQAFPFGIKSFRNQSMKRASNTSDISDLTMSYGNMSFLNSSDDLLHSNHAQPFNPKQKSLVAAVRRSYEEHSVEDFSVYEASQMEELVDDFLQRATILDKAANDCRGQAAELLQVLQKRVQSNSNSASNSNKSMSVSSGVSSASPYLSSMDASARSGKSMNSGNDDVSDISQATGLTSKSNKTVSSLGSLTSLKSFEDAPVKYRTVTMNQLSTVSEGMFESRATSFAASQAPSFESRTGSIFDENLRLALMGEIASKKIKLLIAHTGDCRVVLCDGGRAIQVTFDHTPLIDEEKHRIRTSGGFVSNKRVNGILAVSRSFGDIKFKSFENDVDVPKTVIDEALLPEGIWSDRNQVISMPEVIELEVLCTYEFVVIASDCVWETMTCKEVISFVRSQLLEHGDCMKSAEALTNKVSEEGGNDNCSVIVVNLNQT